MSHKRGLTLDPASSTMMLSGKQFATFDNSESKADLSPQRGITEN